MAGYNSIILKLTLRDWRTTTFVKEGIIPYSEFATGLLEFLNVKLYIMHPQIINSLPGKLF